MIYDERMRMVLYNYVPNEQSKKDVVRAMEENLEIRDHEVIKEFSFSINEPYEKEVIGYGPYNSGASYGLLPDFTGDSEAQARATANRLGISVTFRGSGGYVVSQNYPSGKRLDKISGSVILTLGGGQANNDTTEEEEDSNTTLPKDCEDGYTWDSSSGICVKDPEEPVDPVDPEEPEEPVDSVDPPKPPEGEEPTE